MPNLDGGHYFLTTLLPIDNKRIFRENGVVSAAVDLVREALEVLPTALQSPATEEIGIESPFARSQHTHFARLFVIDNPADNGRDPVNTLASLGEKVDLLQAQPVDKLACPDLVFVADFDPQGAPDGKDEPRAYLKELWGVAHRELSSVLEHCYTFTPDITADGFADLVNKGHVETTLTFNDYWTITPPLPTLPLWPLAIPPIVGLIIGGAIGFGLCAFGLPSWVGWLVGILAAIGFGLGGLFVDVQTILAWGEKPFPTAPNSTLRDVLKALYLQQAFAKFARDHQGQSAAQLRAAFAVFANETRPADVSGPTQPPGVVRGVVTHEEDFAGQHAG